jgi:hypothetical protein
MFLECRECPDDRRLRTIQRIGRRGEAAALDDFDKGPHCGQAIHIGRLLRLSQ